MAKKKEGTPTALSITYEEDTTPIGLVEYASYELKRGIFGIAFLKKVDKRVKIQKSNEDKEI